VGDAVASLSSAYLPLRQVIISHGINGALLVDGDLDRLVKMLGASQLQAYVLTTNYRTLMDDVAVAAPNADVASSGKRQRGVDAASAAAEGRGGKRLKALQGGTGASGSRRVGRPRGQPVEQLELGTGRVVKRYASQRAAGRAMGSSNGTHIGACARGEQPDAHGFGWRHLVSTDGEEAEDDSDDDNGEDDDDDDDDDDDGGTDAPGSRESGHPRRRPVEQLELGTERVIARFSSQRAAARAMGATSGGRISMCVTGKRPQAHGFGWRRVVAADDDEGGGDDDDDDDDDDSDDDDGGTDAPGARRGGLPCQPVEQLELGTGRVIGRYASQAAAARILGLTSSSDISHCVRGERAQAHGFGWRHAVADRHEDEEDDDDDDDDTDDDSSDEGGTGAVILHLGGNPWRPVEQLNLDTGKVIARYASQNAAGRAMGKTDGSTIGDCARGERAEAYGFGWRHAVLGDNDALPVCVHSRPVEQLELGTGKVIARFDSQSAAAQAMGATNGFTIGACARGERAQVHGFGWRHAVADGGDEDDDEEEDDDDDRGAGSHGGKSPCRPVEQLELGTGRVIARYASQKAAGRAMGVTDGSSVGRCVHGKRAEAHGFGWRHADVDDGDEEEDEYRHPAARPVEQIELGTGKVIARFASQTAAALAVGATSKDKRVAKCARGERTEAYGFGWRHVVANGDEKGADEGEGSDAESYSGDTEVDSDDDAAANAAPQPRAARPRRVQPQPAPRPLRPLALSASSDVVLLADREATRTRIYDSLLTSLRHDQQPPEAVLSSFTSVAVDREAHVYSTRASDAAYLAMDDATLLQRAFPAQR